MRFINKKRSFLLGSEFAAYGWMSNIAKEEYGCF